MHEKKLSVFSDEEIFLEATNRLTKKFKAMTQVDFRFGSYEFVIHEGQLRGINEKPNFRTFYFHQKRRSPIQIKESKNES